MADIEKQSITASRTQEQYGAIEHDPKKASTDSSENLPLLLGRWSVSPDRLYKIGLIGFVLWFVIHRLADLAYILTVDARFPEGLGYLYPSEQQRLDSMSYTRQMLFCGMLHRIVVFIVVMSFICFKLFARFDAGLRYVLESIGSGFSRGCTCCCSPVGRVLGFVFSPFTASRPYAWCGQLKDRALNGRLTTEVLSYVGFRLSLYELLVGGIYMTLLGALFLILSAPFMYHMQMIDLKFGFANSLNVSPAIFKQQFTFAVISMLIYGVPKKMVFLAILQYRIGWVLMWGVPIISTIYAQYNVKMIAPMLGMDLKFPADSFAVGRGFPWIEGGNIAQWLNLNRLYFQYGDSKERFFTQDKSMGQLALMHHPSGQWTISGNPLVYPSAAVFTNSVGAAPPQSALDSLPTQHWTIGSDEARIGLRSGKELRDKLFGFARERKIGIGDIYMVDGSHRDPRGNAFVTGAGNHSIIGLYDTLFLGQRGADASEDVKEDEIEELAQGKSTGLLQHVSEVVQDVDIEEEVQNRRAPRNSAPTVAMSDDEIVSILAHELAHSALRHMEQGMVAQVFTTFVTFATLGWMSSSPLAAAALSLHAPLLHVGASAYDHVVAPPVDGIMKLFTDALTRHNEYEADTYAADISEKYGVALQTSLAKLSVNSNQDPDIPFFYEALHADHPTYSRRWEVIEAAMNKKYGKSSTRAASIRP